MKDLFQYAYERTDTFGGLWNFTHEAREGQVTPTQTTLFLSPFHSDLFTLVFCFATENSQRDALSTQESRKKWIL